MYEQSVSTRFAGALVTDFFFLIGYQQAKGTVCIAETYNVDSL
jgi:hypothetical protein